MVLEVAILNVKQSEEKAFEASFLKAQTIIESMKGYVSHQLQRCLEKQGRYILLVTWQSLEDHTVGFRNAPKYTKWKKLLHHYYEPFPEVEHYELVFSSGI
jgi:heme-degrading monooxygenase HmoA